MATLAMCTLIACGTTQIVNKETSADSYSYSAVPKTVPQVDQETRRFIANWWFNCRTEAKDSQSGKQKCTHNAEMMCLGYTDFKGDKNCYVDETWSIIAIRSRGDINRL